MNNNRLFYSPQSSQTRKEDSNKTHSDKSKKQKIDLKKTKENTVKSLNEVEFFLNDFKRFKRYIHLYKFFK